MKEGSNLILFQFSPILFAETILPALYSFFNTQSWWKKILEITFYFKQNWDLIVNILSNDFEKSAYFY